MTTVTRELERLTISAGGIIAICAGCGQFTLVRWLNHVWKNGGGASECKRCDKCADTEKVKATSAGAEVHDYRRGL